MNLRSVIEYYTYSLIRHAGACSPAFTLYLHTAKEATNMVKGKGSLLNAPTTISTPLSAQEQADLARMVQEDEQPVAAPDKLAVITTKAHELQQIERRIASATLELGELAKKKDLLEFGVLPTLMDEAGLKAFTLDDGWEVLREEAIYASMSKENAPKACAWLDKNGYGAIVKAAYTIVIPKGTGAAKVSEFVRKLLTKNKVAFEYGAGVHPQTLLAFVKESLKELRKLPEEIKYLQKPRVQVKEPKAAKKR